MADNVAITPGVGATIACDEVADGTLGTVKVQYVKIMDATLDGTTKAAVGAAGLKVDGSGATQPVSGTVAATQSGTWTVQPGNTANTTAWKVDNTAALDKGAGTGGSATQRFIVDSSQLSALATAYDALNNAGVGGQKVYQPTDQPVPNKVQAQSNGSTSSRVVAAASTNATSLKASAGNITEIDLFNAAAYDVFVKLYNKASAPTVGTDTPTWTVPIKAGTGFSKSFKYGKSFATGIAYAITKLQADSDTTVLVAGDVTGTIDWI